MKLHQSISFRCTCYKHFHFRRRRRSVDVRINHNQRSESPLSDSQRFFQPRNGLCLCCNHGGFHHLEKGKTYGLVGESGSGKSTTGKAIVGLEKITSGEVIYEGQDVTKRSVRKKMNYNKDVQMIFQDSMSSLNPKKRVVDIIAEPLRNFERLSDQEEKQRVKRLLDIVGMPEDALYKYPHEFSGGQRQRLGVAPRSGIEP